MGEHTYMHSVEEDEAELERLRGQTDIYERTTGKRVGGILRGYTYEEFTKLIKEMPKP